MKRDRLDELGSKAYIQGLKSYKGRQHHHAVIFGLDTEYFTKDDRHNILLTWQLSLDKEHTELFTDTLCWESLYDASVVMLKKAGYKLSDISLLVYAVYFSTAEVQWLDIDNAKMELFGSHQGNFRQKSSVKKRDMYIFDLSVWFPALGLGQVANSFKLHKLEYDVTNLTPESLNDPDFVKYAKNDAYITGEILRKLRQTEIKSSHVDVLMSKTPASTASCDFRLNYLPEAIQQHNTNLRRYALMASWGGRKECFFRGHKPLVYEYDAKHFYPSVVQSMQLLPLQGDWHITAELDTWLSAKGGFGTVYFKFPTETHKPNLPVPVGDRICYPLEGFSDCTNFEANVAVQQNAELTLIKGYYYNTGVTWLADYMTALVKARDETKDLVLDLLLKLKSVSIIGKLTQKRLDYDLNEIRQHSMETGIPSYVLLNTLGLPFKKKVSTGSCYYPEWFTLVLGKARAIIARLAIETNAIQIATDAVFTEQYRGSNFNFDGITFRIEAAGDYVAYRSGLYRCADKLRYHGANKNVASKILAEFLPNDYVKYNTRRIISLKMAMWTGKQYGSNYKQPQTVSLSFDGKRILLDSGDTLPLPNADIANQITREWVWYEDFNEDKEKQANLNRSHKEDEH